MITVSDILKNTNAYIGDTSTDRVTADDRYQAVTEATAWLLEELGNEHMVDRAEIEFLPTVMWYKMDSLTPYLLTAGQLRFKNEEGNRVDFTRVEPRDLASMPDNRHAYAIERYNDYSYLGIKLPLTGDSTQNEGCYTDLVGLNSKDSFTYTGTNAENIVKGKDSVSFDMENTGVAATGLQTTTGSIDMTNYEGTGVLIFEVEIPDISDVTTVSIKFGDDLNTDYYMGVKSTDVNGNALVAGINTIGVKWSELTVVGTPTITGVTEWQWLVNHATSKAAVEGFKLSDLRIAKPVLLTFKYIFYRVGKDASGDELIEFSADTDIPFFAERYPQYRYAVAHKAAGVLFTNQRLMPEAGSEDRKAQQALDRFRKNFSGERDMANSAFKVAGVNLRGRRIIRRR